MANVYENTDNIRLKNNKSQSSPDASEWAIRLKTGKMMSNRRVVVVLSVCLLGAVLALCILGIFFSKQHGLQDSIKEGYSNASQQQNSTELQEVFSKLQVSFEELQQSYQELEVRHNTTKDNLSMCNNKTLWSKKYYYFSTEKLNWMDSRDFCVKTGGQLVKITSPDVQSFLASVLQESYWIGLHDLYSEGHWIWVDNTTLSGDTFWFVRQNEPNEPDNWKGEDSAGENCACLKIEGKTWWFDALCSKLKKFICEK